MAAKSHATQPAPRTKRGATTGVFDKPKDDVPRLRPTELPGIYVNADGAQVDDSGVLVSLRRVKEVEAELIQELGEPPQTPAQYLKRVALDPRQPQHTRMQAAIAAAPYFDRKMPLGLEGGDPNKPFITETRSTLIKNLGALPIEERKAALVLLEKLGALDGA